MILIRGVLLKLLNNQIIYPELIYYVTNQDGIEEKIVEPLALKYYYEEQMRNLLQSNGFKIVEEMGYYDRRPISEGPELIFICKKEYSLCQGDVPMTSSC